MNRIILITGIDMFYISQRISRRFFAALMLVAVVPILVMGYGVYKVAENVVIHSAYMHIETIAQDHANHLDTWFGERVNDIQMISQLPFVQDLCRAHCMMGEAVIPQSEKSILIENILALTRAKSLSYRNVHIFSPTGVILASTDSSSEEVSNHDREFLFEAVQRTEGPVLGDVHQHSDKRWYMHLAAPIRMQEHMTVALTLAVLDVSATLDPIMTDRAGMGKTGETYLVSRDGRIITESRFLSRSETLARTFDTEGIRSALEGKSGTGVYRNYMGREVVGSYLWLPRYNWALVAEIEKDEILSPIERIQMAVLAAAAVVGFLSLLLAWIASHRVSRPIIRVAEASREIAEGRFDQRIPVVGSDELGILSESFNSMAERLSIVIESLRHKEASLQKAYQELLQTQEQLVQSEKMAAVGELVTSVVHEMRNPLSSVKLNLQIIGRTIPKEGILSEHYRIALDQVAQLERMFTDLLNYSKPITLDKTDVGLEELIEQSLTQLEPIIRKMKATIDKDFDGALPQVRVDPDKMRQVLVNVIKNALEAGEQNGKVRIAASVSGSNGKRVVTLTISDSGEGISPQDLKRIFQPFFTTKQKGTGLGLPIVKKIMEAHGFMISVSSEEGRGTVVHLFFQSAGDEKRYMV